MPVFGFDQSMKMFKNRLIIFVAFSTFFVVEVSSVADPKFVAHLIYQKVASKLRDPANRQWSYLYLHRKMDDVFYCTNPEVNRILNGNGNEKIPVLSDKPIWPATTVSNMRVAGVDQKATSLVAIQAITRLQEILDMLKRDYWKNLKG